MLDRILNTINGKHERATDATATDQLRHSKVNILNLKDATKHPEDVDGEYMELLLPSDVKTEPTKKDLKILLRRMNKTSEFLDTQRVRGASGEDVTRTEPGPLDRIYGDTSILVALDTEHLDHELVKIYSREESNALPEVELLYEEVPNPTLIPPVFMRAQVLIGTEDKVLTVEDGNHRAWIAKRDKAHPFILAYVPKEDIEFLDESEIVYRKVKDIMDEIPPS